VITSPWINADRIRRRIELLIEQLDRLFVLRNSHCVEIEIEQGCSRSLGSDPYPKPSSMPLMKHTLSRCSALIAVGFLVLSQAVLGDEFFVKEKNRLVPIIGVEKHDPIVGQRGKRKTIEDGEIVAKTGVNRKASDYSMSVRSVKVVSHSNPSSKLIIETTLKTEEAIEGAYLCIRTSDASGARVNTALLALPVLAPGVENTISESIPLSLNWRLGPLHISAFHEGKHIAISHKATELGRSKHGDLYAGAGTVRTDLLPSSRMPRVLSSVAPKQPAQEVLDALDQAYVTVLFFVDTDGVVREASSDDYTQESFVDLAIDALKEFKFSPAIKNGSPYRIKLKQTFWFKRPAK